MLHSSHDELTRQFRPPRECHGFRAPRSIHEAFQEAGQDPYFPVHRHSRPEGPEGDEEAALDEPYFPDLDDAIEANLAALALHGQTNHALLRPDVLEGALGRAQNHWYYEDSLPRAAAALAHGVGQAQAFEDGNKRTAYWLAHHFLHENGLDHIVPEDDTELADHLVGYGEGTHDMEDTAQMFEGRLRNSHRN